MFCPESAEELRRIVLEAGQKGTGLVAVSSGPPHFHGASENAAAETVCFSKMDRIIKMRKTSDKAAGGKLSK